MDKTDAHPTLGEPTFCSFVYSFNKLLHVIMKAPGRASPWGDALLAWKPPLPGVCAAGLWLRLDPRLPQGAVLTCPSPFLLGPLGAGPLGMLRGHLLD